MKLRDVGEFGFIQRIRDGCLIRDENIIKGIGDDCCVFKTSSGLATLVTTDMLVEKVHFLLDVIPPYKLGRKTLAVNISDIAAMGGIPKEAVVAIAIPETVDLEYLDSFYDGMKSMAREFDVNLVGGDTTSSPQHLVISIAMVGQAQEDEVLYRSGARVGDVIFLTGAVGLSAAGLDIILSNRVFDGREEFLNAHFDPHPHVKAGRIIAGLRLANSLIDVSDGVAADLGHICAESNLGAIIEEERIPMSERMREYCARFDQDPRFLSLHVGEDYVLLGTASEQTSMRLEKALYDGGCEFHRIGMTVDEPGLKIRGRDGSTESITSSGWNHFS